MYAHSVVKDIKNSRLRSLEFFLKGDYKQKIRSEKDEKCSLGTGVENLKI